jgi:hypothetical protein
MTPAHPVAGTCKCGHAPHASRCIVGVPSSDGIHMVWCACDVVAGTWLEETLARALLDDWMGLGPIPDVHDLQGAVRDHAENMLRTPAGQSLAARVAALEADRGEDPGSCPECGVHWSAHPNAHDAGIIATPAGQSLAARVAALEAAVPEDPWIVGEAVTYCYSCHLRMMDGHSGACRWLAVRGGASVHRDSADV